METSSIQWFLEKLFRFKKYMKSEFVTMLMKQRIETSVFITSAF